MATAKRTLTNTRKATEVATHEATIVLRFADDRAPNPGALMATVTLDDRIRKAPDGTPPYRAAVDESRAVNPGDLARELIQAAIDADDAAALGENADDESEAE